MGDLYLPLRSNATWFATEGSSAALERRLKMLLVLYDHLLIQDGRYTLTLWDDGSQFLEGFYPLHQLGNIDRTRIHYATPGQVESVSLRTVRESISIPGSPRRSVCTHRSWFTT